MTHSPTPWSREDGNIFVRLPSGKSNVAIVFDPNDHQHRTDVSEANAAHIVKCVNCHEELVEACKVGLLYARTAFGSSQGENNEALDDMRKIEQALKKAEAV